MSHRPKTGLTAKIRKHISKIDGPFSACVAARELGVGIIRFYHVLGFMRQRGEVEKVKGKPGWHEYRGAELSKKPSEARPRLYRAMYVKIRFSVREIAMLADTYPELARYQVDRLLRTGEIERIGRQRLPGRRPEAVYRVRDRDKFFLDHVRPPKGGDRNGEN
jgi:hypothetical protein